MLVTSLLWLLLSALLWHVLPLLWLGVVLRQTSPVASPLAPLAVVWLVVPLLWPGALVESWKPLTVAWLCLSPLRSVLPVPAS
jgi:hypothetical protein